MADPKKGTGKKPKGSGRRLYTDENPRDTVRIKFATPADARATVAKVKKISKDDLIMHVSKLGTKSEQRFYALSFPAGVTLPGTNTDVRQFLLNITR